MGRVLKYYLDKIWLQMVKKTAENRELKIVIMVLCSKDAHSSEEQHC
jgi:hypothetical protein